MGGPDITSRQSDIVSGIASTGQSASSGSLGVEADSRAGHGEEQKEENKVVVTRRKQGSSCH